MNRKDRETKPVKKKRRIYWVLLGVLLFFGLAGLALPFAHHLPFYDKEARKTAYMERGKAYFDAGKYDEARIAFRNALQMDPRLGEAHYYLGLMTMETGALQEAFSALNLATLYAPNLLEAHIRVGEVYFLIEDMARADQKALAIQAQAPERPEGYLLRGKIFAAKGERDSAFAYVHKALERDAMHLETGMVLASLHIQDGKREEAERILKDGLEKHPASVEAHAALAAYYQTAGDLEKVEEVYQAGVQAAPENSLSHFLLGQFYASQNRGEDALAQYRQALNVDPQSQMIKKHLAFSLLTQRQIAGADSLVAGILNTHSGDLDGLYLKGRILLTQGQNPEAIKYLSGVAHRNPDYRFGVYPQDLGYYLGLAYYENGQVLEAREEIRMFQARYPASTHLKLLLANLSLRLGDDHSAIQAAQSALLDDPGNLQASLLLGQSSLRTGNRNQVQASLSRVIEGARQALQEDPNNLQASLLLVQTLAQVENMEEAEQVLASTVAAHAENAEVFVAQGQFYQGAGHYKRAAGAYLAAIGIDAANSRAHLALGQNYAIQAMMDSAEAHYLRALEIDPEFLQAKKHLAHLSLQQQQTARADSLSSEILAQRSGDIDGLYLRGRIRLIQGAVGEAMTAFRQVTRQDPNYRFGSFPHDLGYYLGLAYYENGQVKEAREELEQVLERFPTSLQTRLLVANFSLRLQEHNRAVEMVQGILQDHPDNVHAALMLGPALLHAEKKGAAFKGDTGQVERILQRAAAEHPDAGEIHVALGDFYQALGKSSQAEAAYRTASQVAPDDGRAHMALGRYYASMGQANAATDQFRQALSAEPSSLTAKKNLAYLYFQQHNVAQADSLVSEILKKHPDDEGSLYLKGRIRLVQNRVQEALSALNAVGERQRGYAFFSAQGDLEYYLGLAYYRNGQAAEAQRALARSLEQNPKAYQTRALLAELALRRGDVAQAMAEAREVLASDPNNLMASLALGGALLLEKRWPEAGEAFRRALRQDAQNTQAHSGLGLMYWAQNQTNQAIEAFETVLQINPEAIQALKNIAAIYNASGRSREAIDRCMAHLEHAPNHAGLHQMLGTMMLAQGDDRQAEVHLKKAIELDGTFAQPHFYMGMLHEKRGISDQAIESYEKALEINPQFAEAANNLAWLLAEAERDLERAWSLAEMAQQRLPDDPNVMDTLGWVYYKNQSFHRAVALLEKTVQINPSHPIFHYHLGMAYYKSGDLKAAQNALETSLKLDPASANAEDVRRVLASLGEMGGGL